jgi:fructose-bisphosphate aldolase class I
MNNHKEVIDSTIKALCAKPKGILAADESVSNIAKKFLPLNIENTAQNRNRYREMLFTTPGIENFIAGVILHEETFEQSIEGVICAQYLENRQIVPGIKLDKGLITCGENGEEITQGIDTLNDRVQEFFKKGARFAKWRTVYKISDSTPSDSLLEKNANSQAQYATICLNNGIVPIVEPEVLSLGAHSIDDCYNTTSKVLRSVFKSLAEHKVDYGQIILKPNMVVPGANFQGEVAHDLIAEKTLKCLLENVPHRLPLIVFLSGGQSEEDSTYNLAGIVKRNNLPWRISFSYGRALQESAVKAWAGSDTNIGKGQSAFLKRAMLNSQASVEINLI